jgi:hypothetical protein
MHVCAIHPDYCNTLRSTSSIRHMYHMNSDLQESVVDGDTGDATEMNAPVRRELGR